MEVTPKDNVIVFFFLEIESVFNFYPGKTKKYVNYNKTIYTFFRGILPPQRTLRLYPKKGRIKNAFSSTS